MLVTSELEHFPTMGIRRIRLIAVPGAGGQHHVHMIELQIMLHCQRCMDMAKMHRVEGATVEANSHRQIQSRSDSR